MDSLEGTLRVEESWPTSQYIVDPPFSDKEFIHHVAVAGLSIHESNLLFSRVHQPLGLGTVY